MRRGGFQSRGRMPKWLSEFRLVGLAHFITEEGCGFFELAPDGFLVEVQAETVKVIANLSHRRRLAGCRVIGVAAHRHAEDNL